MTRSNMFDLCDSDAENAVSAQTKRSQEAVNVEEAVDEFESNLLGDDVRSDVA